MREEKSAVPEGRLKMLTDAFHFESSRFIASREESINLGCDSLRIALGRIQSRGAAIVRSPARSEAECRVSCAQSSAPEGRLTY
jgi:hypothetical protein